MLRGRARAGGTRLGFPRARHSPPLSPRHPPRHGARPETPHPDRRDRPRRRHVRVRVRPVAIPRNHAGARSRAHRARVGRDRRRRSATPSRPAARAVRDRAVQDQRRDVRATAATASRPRACGGAWYGGTGRGRLSDGRRAGRVRSAAGAPTARSSRPPSCPTMTSLPGLLTLSDVMGTGHQPRRSRRRAGVARLPSSGTARSGCARARGSGGSGPSGS